MAVKKKTTAKKKPAKKAAKAKKTAAKKPAAKSARKRPVAKPKKKAATARKKAPAKKKPTAAKKAKPARKAKKPVEKAAKAAPVKKSISKKPFAPKKSAAPTPGSKPLPPPSQLQIGRPPIPLKASKRPKKFKKFTAKELREYRQALLNLRDQVVDGISFLSGDNLNRSQRDASGDLSGYSLHMADQGTDNYDREFALNLVSSEQDILYEIDEAIRRVDGGKFGICEMTGEPIEIARLKVLPYARFCVAAQSEAEKGKTRYRPFGPTLTHGG